MTSHPATTTADERAHPPGDGAWWCETWDFDFALPDAGIGGYVRLDLLPNQPVCWYAAALVGAGRDRVVVVDQEVPLPKPPSLELRSEGLWADHIVEEPLDHVSVGAEAFALRLDAEADPLAVPLLGERVPLGLDLGWETDGELVPRPGGYALSCQVVGEILVADEVIALDAYGWRRHTWGPGGRPAGPWARGRHAVGEWLCDEADLATNRFEVVADASLLVPGEPPPRLARTLHRLAARGARSGVTGAAWCDRVEEGSE